MSLNNPNNVGKPLTASRALRLTTYDPDKMPVPTGREEEWRFTPIDRMGTIFDVHHHDFLPEVAQLEGVTVETVAKSDPRVGRVLAPSDRSAVTSFAGTENVTVVTISDEVSQPVMVRVTGDNHQVGNQYLVIEALPHAKASVVVQHCGDLQLNQTVEIVAQENSDLRVLSLQEWDRGATHVSNHRISVGRDARVEHFVITMGGDLVRFNTEMLYDGPGGDANLLGTYFTAAKEHQEHRLFVNHNHPNCKSRVTYKGGLQGRQAHAVWIGDVLIGKNGQGTDSYELNRNLVLSNGAKADSVPNLEIECGEIEGAGHASATGRFDEEQLFYLMSRGIDEATARRLVVHGFFGEMIHQIGIPELEERLTNTVDEQLQQGETSK